MVRARSSCVGDAKQRMRQSCAPTLIDLRTPFDARTHAVWIVWPLLLRRLSMGSETWAPLVNDLEALRMISTTITQ
jgi:hypothetical protein